MTTLQNCLSRAKWVLLIFVVGSIVSVLVSWQLQSANERTEKEAVAAEADQLISDVRNRLNLYQFGLRGVAGAVITAGENEINREIFHRYSTARDFKTEFPGARGFGFIRRVPVDKEAYFIKQARSHVSPNFAIRQLQSHAGDRYLIEYIEPLEKNAAAVGLDIASEINRRNAADSSMRTGEVTLTGPITLVQATGKPLQSFLILSPIFRGGVMPSTIAEREVALFGWSYAPLLMDDVLRGLQFDNSLHHLSLRDITTRGQEVSFYETSQSKNGVPYVFTNVSEGDVFGRRWEFTFQVSSQFIKNLRLLNPHLVLIFGLGVSVLISILFGIFSISQRRKRLLSLEQGRLATIVQNSSDAIIGEGLDGRIISWNRGAEKLFGYKEKEALGKSAIELLIPSEKLREHQELSKDILNDKVVSPFDTVRLSKNNNLIDVTLTAVAIRESDGQISGVAKLLHDIRDKKAAETKLREFNLQLEQQVKARTSELDSARRSLQTILDAVPSLIGYWDKNGINHVANHAYGDWFGVDPRSLYGTHLRDLIGDSMYNQNLPHIEGVLRGEDQTFERSFSRPDGKGLRHSLVHYLPDIVEKEVQGFYAVVNDVSDLVNSRLQLAEAMRENEALLRTINEQLFFSVTDAHGTILEVNDNFCRVSGYDRDDLIGKNHRIISSGMHSDNFWRDMWVTISSGRAWHGEIYNQGRTGNFRWFDTVIAPFIGANGVIERYVALRIDITRRKVIEAKSSELNLLLGNVLRSASEIAIIATDTDGLINIFNSGAEQMLGYSDEETVGKITPACFHLQDEVMERGGELSHEYEKVIEGFRIFVHIAEIQGKETREWTYVRKDGKNIKVSLTVTAMWDEHGKISGYLGVAQDISRRKEFEGYLLQAKQEAEEASKAKGQFLANMSHEIRTPMNAVLGMLQLLKKTDLEARQQDYVDKAFSAGGSLLGLLNDILDFSKIEAGKFELDLHPFDLEDLMQELGIILSGNQGEKPVEVMFDLDPELPPKLIGDKLRLQQILINLAGNALKFTERGHVVVSVKKLGRIDDQINLRISVADTGIGMTQAQLSRIFDGFSQAEASISRRFGGSGLGLVICKRLIALMGGELSVESTFEKGSNFSFEITLAKDKSLDGDKKIERVASEINVLVVDDDALALEILAKMAGSLGWNVKTATSGREAVKSVRASSKRNSPYDVILMDWRMADIDGLTAAKLINPPTPDGRKPIVIMISAYGREVLASAQKEPDAPFLDFLTKPVTSRQLADVVGRAMNGYPVTERQSKISKHRLMDMRLLVVEDNALNRQVAAELLGGEGAHVVLAEGGLQGVEVLLHGDEVFDAVIMDVQMPDIDGLEATRRIRKDGRFTDLPILAMTANVSTADRAACLQAGMTDHIGKPFDLKNVVETLLRLTNTNDVSISREERRPSQDEGEFVESFTSIMVRYDGNIKLFSTISSHLQKDAEKLLDEAESQIKAKNFADSSAAMHALKGIAGTAGAKKLADNAADLESELDAAEMSGASVNIKLLAAMRSVLAVSTEKLLAYAAPPQAEEKSSDTPVYNITLSDTEWRKKLTELAALLAAGNLNAIDFVDNLGGLPDWIDKAQYSILLEKVQSLEFEAAAAILQEIIQKG